MAIQELVNSGIINGFPDGTYRPGVTLKREEFASLITRMLGYHPGRYRNQNFQAFIDNQNELKWYFGYVQSMKDFRIMVGYDGIFGVGQPMTREAAIVALIRAYGLSEQLNSKDRPDFDDSNQISSWAVSSVSLAQIVFRRKIQPTNQLLLSCLLKLSPFTVKKRLISLPKLVCQANLLFTAPSRPLSSATSATLPDRPGSPATNVANAGDTRTIPQRCLGLIRVVAIPEYICFSISRPVREQLFIKNSKKEQQAIG
jgi:hypothetical protein